MHPVRRAAAEGNINSAVTSLCLGALGRGKTTNGQVGVMFLKLLQIQIPVHVCLNLRSGACLILQG